MEHISQSAVSPAPAKKLTKKAESISKYVLQNMSTYNTTCEEAQFYESHCHNCGISTQLGKRYCNDDCLKFVEQYNFDCYYGQLCKMCRVCDKYIELSSNFELLPCSNLTIMF